MLAWGLVVVGAVGMCTGAKHAALADVAGTEVRALRQLLLCQRFARVLLFLCVVENILACFVQNSGV